MRMRIVLYTVGIFIIACCMHLFSTNSTLVLISGLIACMTFPVWLACVSGLKLKHNTSRKSTSKGEEITAKEEAIIREGLRAKIMDKIRHYYCKIKDWCLHQILMPNREFLPLLGYGILFCFALGWLSYVIPLYLCGKHVSILEIIGYGAVSATDNFLLDINSNITDAIKGEDCNFLGLGNFWTGLLQSLILIAAVLSFLCTFSLLLKLVIRQYLNYKHTLHAKIDQDSNHLYIFWGLNDNSIKLAKSIRSKSGDNKYFIVFIDNDEDEEVDEHDGVNSVINFVSNIKSKSYNWDPDNRSIYIKTHVQLSEVKPNTTGLWGDLRLEKVEELILKLENTSHGELHIFFLSDNRDENVGNTNIMNGLIRRSLKGNIKCRIYCQSRKDAVTSIVEDVPYKEGPNVTVTIVDESVLSIEKLKEQKDLHPFNFVEIETENPDRFGAAKTEFTSLVFGFGETGRDALRFLYEYSAFIDANAERIKRSPISCHVVDANMNSIKGHFVFNHPAINSEINIKDNRDKPLVEFHQFDDKSEDFYDLLSKIAQKLNYIVVAVGDDEKNITIAVNILKFIRFKGADLNKLCILVRAYGSSSFSHLLTVREHYNGILKEDGIKHDIIHIFGEKDELYNYETIISRSFIKKAKEYYKAYRRHTPEGAKYAPNWEEDDEGTFDKRRQKILSIKEGYKHVGISVIDNLHRMEFQDISNAWHALTKLGIIQRVLSRIKEGDSEILLKSIAQIMFRKGIDRTQYRVANSTYTGYEYPADDLIVKSFGNGHLISDLINNIAITEHLRWNASHEMLGYSYAPGKKNPVLRTHACITYWDELETLDKPYSVRLYDYLVVENTLRLITLE